MLVRIVKRTAPDGKVQYVIQQKHFIMWWQWVDARVNNHEFCLDTFDTFEEAERNLCWFDGTKSRDEVVLSRKKV